MVYSFRTFHQIKFNNNLKELSSEDKRMILKTAVQTSAPQKVIVLKVSEREKKLAEFDAQTSLTDAGKKSQPETKRHNQTIDKDVTCCLAKYTIQFLALQFAHAVPCR